MSRPSEKTVKETHLFIFLIATKDYYGQKQLISCDKMQLTLTYQASKASEWPTPPDRQKRI
jgi:hypothetical protein